MTRRAVRLITITVLAVAVGWVLAPLYADAWGDGRICLDGITHTFDNEPDYYAFLAAHPDAVEGACTEEVPPSSTNLPTTVVSTSVPQSAPPSSTTVSVTPPSSTFSTPSPVPVPTSSDVGLPGAMCTDGCTETFQSSTTVPPINVSPTPSTPSAGELPATGGTAESVAVAAVLVLGLGFGAALLARRRPAITDRQDDTQTR